MFFLMGAPVKGAGRRTGPTLAPNSQLSENPPRQAANKVANPANGTENHRMPSRSPANPPVAATPMAFARSIAAAYKRHGQSPEQALKLAQITPNQLKQPTGHITARQMELLSGAAMQELDDEGLGAFSRKLPWGSYGMLARASISSPHIWAWPSNAGAATMR